VALAACPGKKELPKGFPNQPGGNPLVPEIALLPFPSDFYLEPDPATPTGRRVVLPEEALPNQVPAAIFGGADGFSMSPAIVAWLPGGIDPASLPDPLDEGASLEDESPVWLVRTSTGERVPVLAELDQNTEDVLQQTLILRPHVKLEPNEGYVVILRSSLRDRAGRAHEPGAAFLALRDGRATGDPAVEKLRPGFVLVTVAIAAQGISPEEVVLAWSFHTRSEENVVQPLLRMQEIVWSQPAADYTIVTDGLDDSGENRILDGVFQAPSFRNAEGLIELDGDGEPILQGTEEAELMVVIPTSVEETRPVMLYGHGFFSSYDEASWGAPNKLCREKRLTAVSTNFGFNLSDSGMQIMIMSQRQDLMDRLVAHHLQKIVNFTALAKLTRDRLSQDITGDVGGVGFHPLDGQNVHYAGISNGGTFGYVVASTSPAITRAALIVGGGGLTHFLQRAVNWHSYQPLFDGVWDEPLEMQLVLTLMQIALDPIDSINYAHRLATNRFPGLPDLKASVHMAVNDSQVRNLLTEWIVRSAGVPLVVPSPKAVWGLETVDASALDGSALPVVFQVYDEHVEAPPLGNVPPEEDNGTHGSCPKQPSLQEHWYQILANGRFAHVCDGACDPN
jgi:pimeloyl-ACP methyl ester carboxylesterase